MKVAVTGAGGFIGTATLAVLENAGFDVKTHLGPEQFDICDLDAVAAFVSGCDAVVHLAGPPSVAASLEHPVEYVRAHVLGTAAVLEAMRAARVASLVYVSSADVYATSTAPVPETQPLAPRSPYAASKAAAEQLVRAASAFQQLNGYVIRPFSVYGPGMPEDSLVATILRQARDGTEIFVRDVSPIRDYCFVEDLAHLIAAALRSPRREILTLNAAFGRGYSVAQVVEEIGAALGLPLLAKERGPRRPSGIEISHLVADVGEARRALGWYARYDLRDGIRATCSMAVR